MANLISVIVPVYNPGSYFRKCIDSILDQGDVIDKIIVINDGSKEEYKEFIFNICNSNENIRLINLFCNVGGGNARNFGLSFVTSKYVAFCDCDDFWPSNKLQKQLDFLEKNNFLMTHTDMVRVGNESESFIRTSDEIDLSTFLKKTNIFCSSVVVRKSALDGFSFGTMKARHPFKLWVGLLSSGVISYRTPNTFFYYSVNNNSVSSNKLKMFFYTLFAYFYYVDDKISAIFYLIHRLSFNYNNNR